MGLEKKAVWTAYFPYYNAIPKSLSRLATGQVRTLVTHLFSVIYRGYSSIYNDVGGAHFVVNHH